MAMMLLLAVVIGLVIRGTTPEDRVRYRDVALAYLSQLVEVAVPGRRDSPQFRDALLARTRWAIVTPAFVVLNVTLFFLMTSSDGPLGDPDTLVGWGGNFGPRTTNGEWWRLVTAQFVHSGTFHLLVSIVSLIQIGLILERLVGHLAFASIYLSAGTLASLVSLSSSPIAVTVGAAPSVLGLYGLLLASLVAGLIRRSEVTIPWLTVRRLLPAAAVFMAYTVGIDGELGQPNLVALVMGFGAGLGLTISVAVCKPPMRRIITAVAATVVMTVIAAVPLRGLADVRPEIARIVATEKQTADAYQKEVELFQDGRLSTAALAQMIEGTIIPELEAASARLKAIEGVPDVHRPAVTNAAEYLRLRIDSWHVRAQALHKSSMVSLRKADAAEQAALEVFRKIEL